MAHPIISQIHSKARTKCKVLGFLGEKSQMRRTQTKFDKCKREIQTHMSHVFYLFFGEEGGVLLCTDVTVPGKQAVASCIYELKGP